MALVCGSKLGPYEIKAPLGAGGMGEVTADGLIIIVGCSHPGIDKIVELATATNPHIHVIVGGFHLRSEG